MGNCLKTQLKESVNNSNLDVLGYYRISIDTTGCTSDLNMWFRSEPTGAYIVGSGTFKNGKTRVDAGDGENLLVEPNNQFIIMCPKYIGAFLKAATSSADIDGYAAFSLNLDNLKYIAKSSELSEVVAMQTSVNNTNKLHGKLENWISSFPNLLELRFEYQDDVQFDLDLIGTYMPKVEFIQTTGCAKFTGSLENYIVSRKNNPPTVYGSILLNLFGTGVTFNNALANAPLRAIWEGGNINVYIRGESPTLIGSYDITNDVWTYYPIVTE